MPTRTRLATGIYADLHGISVVYRERGRPIETRFDRGTNLERLVAWRTLKLKNRDTRPLIPRDSLTRDVVRYLKRLKGLQGYKAEKSHLRAWLHLFGASPRRALTPEKIELAMARWRQEGYAPRTIRHRCRALISVFRRLDGPQSVTPFDGLRLPAKPRPRPVSVSDETIAEVAMNLRKQEMDGIGRLRDTKTRARYLVLATHAQRPAEVQRTKPEDVDLERGLWAVRSAKGGINVIVPLNDEQRAAWQLFIAAQAWGAYDTRSFARTLRTAGWPKGIRPYNLRHSTGFALSTRGVDLGDIQGLLGHASPETTRIYVPGQLARLTAAGKTLEGRFRGDAFLSTPLPRKTLPRSIQRQAKGLEKAPQKRRA